MSRPVWIRLPLVADILEKADTLVLDAASRLSGGRRPMGPDVERAHPPRTRSPLYNESFYFNFFDQNLKSAGFIWIGKLPNQKTINSVLVIFAPGKDVLALFATEPYPRHTDVLRCGPMAYEPLEPLWKWRILSSGDMVKVKERGEGFGAEDFFAPPQGTQFVPVSLDFTFTGVAPVHNSKDYCAAALARQMREKNFGLKDFAGVRKIAANHYEQVGTCEGTLRIKDKEYTLHAMGHRDHSWGIRDWYAPKAWTWLTVQFGADAALNLCRMVVGDIDLFMGFILHGGKINPLSNASLETEFEPDGYTQKNIRFFAQDTSGFSVNVTGKAHRVIRLARGDASHRVVVNEAMTLYEWEGRQAWGISEYLKKLS